MCQCDSPGYCETFAKVQSPRSWAICRDAASDLTPQQCAIYRADWLRMKLASSRGDACVHRGDEQRRERCPTCPGSVGVKVFACDLHGECTIGEPLAGLACCATCEDYSPSD